MSLFVSERLDPDWSVLLIDWLLSRVPETVMLGKNSLFEILIFSSMAFKFSLSAFNFGLFLYADSIKNIRSGLE